MAKLIPLNEIPYRARQVESEERAKWPTRKMALDAASWRIVWAAGTYSEAFPPTHGWVLTYQAADALSEIKAYPPGNSGHRLYDYQDDPGGSDALGIYMEDIARGMDEADALAKYEAAKA